MIDYHPPFIDGYFYHVYNRGNNKENLFYTPENYRYFLNKYDEYLSGWLDTYVYSLMPNHFHFLVKVKQENERFKNALKTGMKTLTGTDVIISELFRRLFTSYAKAINIQEKRVGSLFQKKFKRITVTSENKYTKLIYYIHSNPQKHGLASDFKTYPYSSYSLLISDQPTILKREEIMEWFGNKTEFIKFHTEFQDTDSIDQFMIEA